MNIWKDCEQVPLTSLLSFIVDNRGKTVPLIDDKNGIKLIATNCIKNESLYPVYEKVRFLSEETYKTWFRAHPRPGDIIFVNKGTPGKVAFVPDPIDFCIAQDMMAFRVNPAIVYNKYLFAVLRSSKIQEQIRITSVGDVIPHFKKEFLDEIKIPLPDLKIQKYLGDMYFMYSEKIELNKNINENLEQQAQALFKSWFVDFEPFGGKMPEGWKLGTVGDLCSTVSKTYKGNDSHVVLINTSDVEDGTILNHESVPNSKLKGQFKKTFQKDDILYSEIRPANKHYAFVDIETTSNYIASTKLMVIRPNEGINPHYLYHILTNPDLIQEMQHLAETRSGTFPQITFEGELSTYQIPLLPKEEQDKLGELFKNIDNQIFHNIKENKQLSTIRDTLLAKLMNGEIDINRKGRNNL